MKRLLLIALLPLAGCQGMHGGAPNPNWVPLPTGNQVGNQNPYMMPVPNRQQQRAPMHCTTRYVGNQAYTDCY